jgi:hypothetical protein
MPRVCIVEMPNQPAPGILERRLTNIDGFAVRTVAAAPDPLDELRIPRRIEWRFWPHPTTCVSLVVRLMPHGN